MPMVRYQIRNEYGLSDPDLYTTSTSNKDDPEELLEGVAMAGLVGLLRQLGDLSEFAAEIFHDLHEEVMATASRGHGLTLRLHQLEAEFPSVEMALISKISLPNVTQTEGIQWHTNVQIDQNLITRGDMPRFVMDSYEECQGPPRLFTLDKFDVAGAGACLKRYSDPSLFKTELASSCSIETGDAPRERKPRKIKKKTTRWKKGETLESLLISSSESPPSSGNQSSGKTLISRVVKLKTRRLRNSDNNARKMYHYHLLELVESQQKIILEDSRRQSAVKPESNGISKEAFAPALFQTEIEAQKMHKVYPIQEQHEASSGSEKIQIGTETYSSRQTREKAMTDSDDMASENENFLDALNTIESEMETDNEKKSKSDPVSCSQEQMVHGNLGSDSVCRFGDSEKNFKLNEEIEYGEATEEFFDNDDLMDVSSTSSLHSDGIHQTEQLFILHENNVMPESEMPADDNENVLGALEKPSTVNEFQLGSEDLIRNTTQIDEHREQTNFHLENMNMHVTDASPETSGISGVVLNSQEIKLHEEKPIFEESSGFEESNKYVITNNSSSGLEELEEPLENPVKVSQVELRNISDEIVNLEEYLISTRKDESISQDILSHGDKDAHIYDITTEPFDVHTEETTQNLAEDRLEDNRLEDALDDERSLFSNKEETSPRSTASIPTRDATELSTHKTGFDLEEVSYEIRIQHPTSSTFEEGQSTSNQELEVSSSGPHSPVNISEGTSIQGYPKYHMDNFIEPDEGSLDLGETKVETCRNKSLHHPEIDTQSEQFNESEDFPQYLDRDVNTDLPIIHEPTDKSLQDNSMKNSDIKLHEVPLDGDDFHVVHAENPFCRNSDVRADGMHTNNSAPFSSNEECDMWVEDLEAGEKEEGLHPADFLCESTGSPCEQMFEPEFVTEPPTITSVDKNYALTQTDGALGSPDTSQHYDGVGDHQVPEHRSEREGCYIVDANNVDGACDKILSVEDGFAHANLAATSVNEHLKEDSETKSLEISDDGEVNDEAPVENSRLEERVNANDSAPIPFMVKDEVLVEAYTNNDKDCAVPTSSVVTTEAFVAISELNEEGNAKGCGPTLGVPEKELLFESLKYNEVDSAEGDVPTSPLVNFEELVKAGENNDEGDVPASPVVNYEAPAKTSETNRGGGAEGGVSNPFVPINEVLVEDLIGNEINGAEGGLSTNNEVCAENSEIDEESDAECGVPLPLEVKRQVIVEDLKINEEKSAESSIPSSVVNNVVHVERLESNEKVNYGVPIHSVDNTDELLQNTECKTEKKVSVKSSNVKEESAHTGPPTPSGDYVPEVLREPTNLCCHEPDTPPSTKDEESHHESVSYADLFFTTEERNMPQSCTVSPDNPLYDASLSENILEECSELRSKKPVPFTNLHNGQEKPQEDNNQIATDIFPKDSTSEPWPVDPNKSSFHSSSIEQDQKVAKEGLGFGLETGNIFSGSNSINEVLANIALDVTVETKEKGLDMCSAYSLPSEHKPPPLPPLGWRMGGKLSKGTLLPTNGHASKPIDETNQNLSLQMRSMEAPLIANCDDFARVEEAPLIANCDDSARVEEAPLIANCDDSARVEGEKPRIMSLSDLPPLSYQQEVANPNLASVPISGGNLQNVEYNNGLGTAIGVTGPEMRVPQYVWPDAQHTFLPVPAWNTGPSLVPVHQPGYLISMEDNLWAQYGVGLPYEDERLGRKHQSIRDMPRNPLMDAVAAHDRSTMRKVSELVRPDDDKSKADERNSMLEQIRNKSFSLRPVGAPRTTSVKAPQANLKVAAIVERANAIRQAFVGSDEEDGDSWSDG